MGNVTDINVFRSKNLPVYFYKVRYQFKGYDSTTVLSSRSNNPQFALEEFKKVLPDGAIVFVPEFKFGSHGA